MATHRSTAARLAGTALASVGIAHLVNPRQFAPLTRRAFPRRTWLYTYLNGAVATAVGLGLRTRRTRSLAMLTGVGYGAHLSGRAASTARRTGRARKYGAAVLVDTEPLL